MPDTKHAPHWKERDVASVKLWLLLLTKLMLLVMETRQNFWNRVSFESNQIFIKYRLFDLSLWIYYIGPSHLLNKTFSTQFLSYFKSHRISSFWISSQNRRIFHRSFESNRLECITSCYIFLFTSSSFQTSLSGATIRQRKKPQWRLYWAANKHFATDRGYQLLIHSAKPTCMFSVRRSVRSPALSKSSRPKQREQCLLLARLCVSGWVNHWWPLSWLCSS